MTAITPSWKRYRESSQPARAELELLSQAIYETRFQSQPSGSIIDAYHQATLEYTRFVRSALCANTFVDGKQSGKATHAYQAVIKENTDLVQQESCLLFKPNSSHTARELAIELANTLRSQISVAIDQRLLGKISRKSDNCIVFDAVTTEVLVEATYYRVGFRHRLFSVRQLERSKLTDNRWQHFPTRLVNLIHEIPIELQTFVRIVQGELTEQENIQSLQVDANSGKARQLDYPSHLTASDEDMQSAAFQPDGPLLLFGNVVLAISSKKQVAAAKQQYTLKSVQEQHATVRAGIEIEQRREQLLANSTLHVLDALVALMIISIFLVLNYQ